MASSGARRSAGQSNARSGKTRQAARTVILSDLYSGDPKVLVEMIAGAQTAPGLAAQVAERLVPWYAFAEAPVNKASTGSPLRSLLPVGDIAHAVVAGVLGLELLASLDADHTRAKALLDHAAGIALLLSAMPTPSRPT